ncbi:carbohydrate ABC transporter permease [Saxibacter everestensis]|uniref:Carbohydrate ABC transporter permease n=1 Tax=Saxibacter everestensis TaxID=2909229 RepID=A0ABY8QR24_9MICO|nr:carbohydrate ABC transporter permease [Brevibacteriaceae bacterium ZFBP1038]
MISSAEKTFSHIILALFSLAFLMPIVVILSNAVGDPNSLDTGLKFDGFHWQNFVDAWTIGHFGGYIGNSALVTVTVVVATCLLSIPAAYAFGTMRFPGSTVLYYLFVLGLMLPQEAVIIPLYFNLRGYGLTDSLWALIIPQTAQSLAFGVFWMRTYFRAAPKSIVEAARLDGCNSWKTLLQILVPLGRPAITTMVVIVFMWTWNEFLLALVMVSSDQYRTVPLGLAFFQGQHSSDTAQLAAAALLIAAPVVIVYLIFQRKFIEGVLGGAVKE